MKKRFISLAACVLLSFGSLVASDWHSDVLGDGYQMRYVEQPDDYAGKVRSTIVRKQAANSKKAVLYVHGYNDYFFQKEMGDKFIGEGYNFYAVDLRKYGRSILPGQRKFEAQGMDEYFPDIDAAMKQIVADGNTEIVLMGHSTGGLTTSYYMAKGMGNKYPIKALVLNSPFLDWNLGGFVETVAIPLVCFYSHFFKNTTYDQNGTNDYARALLKKYGGEWDYNTDWKMEISPEVTTGWVAAITKAQDYLKDNPRCIKVPIYLMHSDKTGEGYSKNSDVVLDVNDIAKYGRKLGSNVSELVVRGGVHDLVLSEKPVRNSLYKKLFIWLRQQ